MTSGVLKKGIGALLLLWMAGGVAYAQFTIQHQAPVAVERGEVNVLEFLMPGITENDIRQARIFYRYDGDISYRQREVNFQNGRFRVQFLVDDNTASTLEYYFEVTLASGEGVHYPGNLPSENPVEVEIVDNSEEESLPQLEGIDYTILSPRPGNGVTRDNVIIALALFYEKSDLEPGEFRLKLDRVDITEQADTSDYYISYVPDDVPPGMHTVALEYKTEEQTYAVTDWQFAVVAPGQASFGGFGQSRVPEGQVELTARNQVIAGNVNNAYTGRTNISGAYGDFNYSVNGYLTSQEDPRLQPQNRYGVNLSYGDIWDFEAGHVYPSMSQFTISGRRVHGINTSLHLLKENINFQFVYGELDREVTNLYDSLKVQEVTNSADSVLSKNYILSYQNGGRGTFQRDVIGGRVSFGREEKFQWGVHALKIQDDTSSIFNARDYMDIVQNPAQIPYNTLDAAERDSLLGNPDLLEIQGGNPNPRGNIVAGTDLQFGLAQNRIRFETETVVSALNNNINGGPLTTQQASDLGFDIDQGTADILEQLSWLIIVNENMSTLPLRLNEDQNGDISAEPYFPTSILANNTELSMRYPVSNIRVQYRWIGPNFNSLANSTVRKDIAGFTLSDRLNLLSNRLYVTLGYENLNNNVAGTEDATTNTITYRTNVSWYPVSRSLPRVSASMRYRTRDNAVQRENIFLTGGLVDAAIQNVIVNADGDTVVTATPRNNTTINLNTSITQQFNAFNARNDISLSYTNLNTTDMVFAFGDVSSSAVSASFTSRFNDSPLELQFGINYNDTQTGSGQSNIKIVGYYGGGEVSFIDDRLTVDARLALTQNETTTRAIIQNDNTTDDISRDDYYELGDETTARNFKTYVIQAGAQFDINENHALIFNSNLTNVSGQNRANDRIAQLRYVFRF